MKKITSLCILGLVGCTHSLQFHGYQQDSSVIEALHTNVSTADDVIATMGSPTSHALFGQPTFFYVSNQYQKRLFRTPKLVDQHIIMLRFDNNGVLNEIKQYSMSDVRKIKFSTDSIDIHARELGIIEQAIGNIGRFNNKLDKPGS